MSIFKVLPDAICTIRGSGNPLGDVRTHAPGDRRFCHAVPLLILGINLFSIARLAQLASWLLRELPGRWRSGCPHFNTRYVFRERIAASGPSVPIVMARPPLRSFARFRGQFTPVMNDRASGERRGT